jgi:23S rRNA pseudouridine2605 synthase
MRKRIEKDDIRRSESTRKFSGPSSGGSSARKPTKNFTDRSTGNKPTSDRGGRSEFRSSEPRSFDGPKREFSGDRERKPYNPERKPYAGDRPSRPYQGGDSNSESRPRREFDGPKREFSGDRARKPFNPERKPYAGDRPNRAFQVGDSNSESQPPREFDGPKREFSGDREHKPFQADGSETERPKRVFDREKSDDSSKDFREAPTSKFSKRDTFKSRNRYEESPAHTPQYKLDRFKEKAPAKIQRRIREVESKSDMVRLNRYIANAGICSRRDADKLIEAGEIKVNNKVITEMGYQVAPTDIVKYGNRKLNREKPVYVLLNKPKDFLTTTEDPNDRKTVMELVKNAGDARIYPVGRLDRNTTGLILLSNDGELADRLTHPSHEIEKIYQAELDKPLTDEDFEKIKAGLTLEDGEIKVDDLAKVTPDGYVIGVKIHSGKNRIVRRIFEHLGYEVTKLDRTTFAGLTKKDLPRGHWRYLTERELVKLKYFL